MNSARSKYSGPYRGRARQLSPVFVRARLGIPFNLSLLHGSRPARHVSLKFRCVEETAKDIYPHLGSFTDIVIKTHFINNCVYLVFNVSKLAKGYDTAIEVHNTII